MKKIKIRRDRKLTGEKTGLIIELHTEKKVYKISLYRNGIQTHVSKIMMR
jgi:hypothetical protein